MNAHARTGAALILLASVLGVALCNMGCNSWGEAAAAALNAAHRAANTVHQREADAIQADCLTIARRCPPKPAACSELTACKARRLALESDVSKVTSAIDLARVAVDLAVSIDGASGSKAKAQAALAHALEAVAALQKLISSLKR